MRATHRLVRLIAASTLGLALTLPNGVSRVDAQFYPTGTGRMDSGTGGGILDDNSPFMWAGARMNRAYGLAGQMEHIRALEAKVEAQAYEGMLDGTYSPVVRYTDGSANVAQLLARKVVKAGYKHMTQAQAQTFLTAREADYEREVGAQNLPARSLTSSCAYWVDSLYAVGASIQSSPSDREQMRATCALTIGKTEKIGQLTDNEQRYTIGQSLGMIGATLRTLSAEPSEHDGAVAGAKAMFKSNFGYAIGSVPVSRFPCVLSENSMRDCDTIMSRYGARLPDIARRNT